MTIIWVPTWRCQRRCVYCDYDFRPSTKTCWAVDHHIPATELEPRRWIAFFQKIGTNHIELTGGEPTLYDLQPVLENLPSQVTWAMTSNGLTGGLIDSLPYDKCTSITLSYHYDATERFFEQAHRLRDKKPGLGVRITIVVTPQNLDEIPGYIERIRNEGFHVNLHPLLKLGHIWDDESWAKIRSWDNKPSVYLVDEIPSRWDCPERHLQCALGSTDYMAIAPTGHMYRCYRDLVYDRQMDHIDTWRWSPPRWATCSVDCKYPCDQTAYRRLCAGREPQ